VQQVVLLWLLGGGSLHQAAVRGGMDRRTVGRWWDWLVTRSKTFGFWLRARFVELGRAVDCSAFWLCCLSLMPLSRAMAWLDQAGVVVP
jgi:hypothetical protein